MKHHRRRKIDKIIVPKKVHGTEKLYHEKELLNSKALIAVGHYLDYGVTDRAKVCMEKLFKEYKRYRNELRDAIIDAFKFITKGRYILDPEFPMYKPAHEKPSKSRIIETKKCINEIANKMWKK